MARTLAASEDAYDDFEAADQAWLDFRSAVAVINNWRASHAYPLNTFQVYLRKTASRFDDGPLIAQRIKRLVSIGAKLNRQGSMKLPQMQDVGGCRAILANVSTARSVFDYYQNESGVNIKDYRSTTTSRIRNDLAIVGFISSTGTFQISRNSSITA